MVPVPRHAALSLWLSSGGDPAQIAARAGHSVAVLLNVYSHCIHGRDDLLNQQIDHVLEPPAAGRGPCLSVRKPAVRTDRRPRPASGCTDRTTLWKASGCIDRDGRDAVSRASVISSPGPPTAPGPRQHQTATATPEIVIYPA